MKKTIAFALVCALLACMLSGCGSEGSGSVAPTPLPTQQPFNFAPETTAVATGGLSKALESVGGSLNIYTETATEEPKAPEASAAPTQQPEAPSAPVVTEAPPQQDSSEPDVTAAPTPTPGPTEEPVNPNAAPVQPFATATPQPNTAINGYSTVSNTGLGFKFSYPNGWQNIPGRSTVCYLQPVTDGTVYPARVSVSMKELSHKGNMTRLQEQMVGFMESLLSQYDEKTFEVEDKLSTDTKFMGNKNTLATTYLAYDGAQEIEGYVIMTYFERYVFCYHFVSAYEDFEAFGTAMRHMRDSVTTEATETGSDDD